MKDISHFLKVNDSENKILTESYDGFDFEYLFDIKSISEFNEFCEQLSTYLQEYASHPRTRKSKLFDNPENKLSNKEYYVAVLFDVKYYSELSDMINDKYYLSNCIHLGTNRFQVEIWFENDSVMARSYGVYDISLKYFKNSNLFVAPQELIPSIQNILDANRKAR